MRDEALELHRPHLRAVLLALAGTLGPLVVIEVTLDPVDAAVEHVHERPQQRVQVGLQTGVRQRRNQRVEHVGECALQLGGLRQRTRIGLIVVGAMGIEGELFEKMGGRGHRLGNLGIVGEAVERHGVCSSWCEAAPMRGLLAIRKPGAAEARTQRRSLQGRSAAEDGEHGFLVSRGMAAAQAAPAAPGCRQGKKAARSRCGAQPLPAPSPS